LKFCFSLIGVSHANQFSIVLRKLPSDRHMDFYMIAIPGQKWVREGNNLFAFIADLPTVEYV